MVRIGLVGCGRWGRNILRDLRLLGTEVSVADISSESRDAARQLGAENVVDSVDALPEIDGFVVAVPTAAHGALVLQLAGTRLPVFCEKPLTNDVRAARAIVAAAGERVFVMDKWRYHGGVRALAAIARSGELGPVQGVVTRRVGWGCPHADVDVVWILLPHDLTIGLEILGELPRPVSAAAECDERGVLALAGLLRGAAWHRFEIGARSASPARSVELRCRDGVATLAGSYDEVVRVERSEPALRGGRPPAPELRAVDPAMPLYAELEAFVAFLAGRGPAPKSSAAEGAAVVAAIEELRALAGV
jgi:predicted dehydrogenase